MIESMSLQADRVWVQQEVGKVTNPRLMEALKALLLYREETLEKKNEDQLVEELISRALKSEEDIKEGRVYSFEEAEERVKKRLGV